MRLDDIIIQRNTLHSHKRGTSHYMWARRTDRKMDWSFLLMLSHSSTRTTRVVVEDSSLDSQISARETLSDKKVVERFLF